MRRLLAALMLVGAVATPALARVGGGESWGGGGGGSDGGGGGDILWILELLIRLVIWEPSLGVPVVIGVVIWFAYMASHAPPQYYSSQAEPPPEALQTAGPSAVEALRGVDANFSQTLFMDFVQLLYVRFHMERAQGRGPAAPSDDDRAPQGGLSALAPYFAPGLLRAAELDAQQRAITKVSDALVGSSHIAYIDGTDEASSEVRVDVIFEGNFTEWTPTGALPPMYVTERWAFRRKKGVLSKGPDDITSLACPSCGNPSALRPDGSCPYCGRVVNQGDFQWVVATTQVLSSLPRPPVDLVGGQTVEVGTDLPTVFAPNFATARRLFMARRPTFSWSAFEKRVRTIFGSLQEAWSTKQWLKARPFETDSLFNMHRYWMDMYERQRLTNRLDNVAVSQVVPAKFDQDAFYDIITVRIYASMLDFTINEAGLVVRGDSHTPRVFSEYWTFIRRRSRTVASTPPPPREEGATGGAPTLTHPGEEAASGKEQSCPNCGAPLQVNMAGDCTYCNSRVTSGNFDWVLSSIKQDEAYRG